MEHAGISQAAAAEVNDPAIPKVRAARAVDERTLVVEFTNNEKKRYDIGPLLDREMFFALSNSAFFRNVRVEQGGYAVFWNEDIDISEYELWRNGTSMPPK